MSSKVQYGVFKRGGENATGDWLDVDTMTRAELVKYIEKAELEGLINFLDHFEPVENWSEDDRVITKIEVIVLKEVEREVTRKVKYLELPEDA